MASLCRFLRRCDQMKICKCYSKLEHVASFSQFAETSVTNKNTRADRVKPEVKLRLHKILEEKQGYHETLFVPQILQAYQAAVNGGGHVNVSPASDVPNISHVINKTAGANTDEVLKSHFTRTLANLTYFDKHAVNLCLYELDALFMNNVDITNPVYAFLSLVDMHWFNLMDNKVIEPRHVVHMMFFIGAIRNAPATLFQHLEDYLTINANDLDIKEWSLVCNSFFTSNRRISSIDLLRKIADALLKNQYDCPLNLLSNFMKVFHHSGYDQFGFCMQLGDVLAKRSDLFRMYSLTSAAHILHLYASVRIVHERLFEVLEQGICHALKMGNARSRLTKDLCRICWAFTSLQEPVPYKFLRILEEELLFNVDQYLWNAPETTIEILTTLAVNGIYPREILSRVFSSAFLKFKQKRLLEQDFQLQLLETSARLNLSDLRIKRLSNEFHEKALENRPDIKSQVGRRTGLQPLIRGLLASLPSPKCLMLHHILPHSKILDVEVRFNAQGQPIEHPNGLEEDDDIIKSLNDIGRRSGDNFSVMQKLGVLHGSHCGPLSNMYSKAHTGTNRRKTNEIRLVIKIYGWNQYTRNPRRLLGLHHHEINLLNQLGYHVIGINPADASHLEDTSEEELSGYIDRYILRKIK